VDSGDIIVNAEQQEEERGESAQHLSEQFVNDQATVFEAEQVSS